MSEELKLVLERQHEHFMKLLDLFETRQTQAFNFAFVAYAAGITAFGVLLDKLYNNNGTPDYVHVVGIVLLVGIVLPLVFLPLCFLYADVSVYCAALNEGNIQYFNRLLNQEATEFIGPGRLAFEWLCETEEPDDEVRLRQEGGASNLAGALDIEWVANYRVSLFYIAPVFGLAACAWALYLGLRYSSDFDHLAFVLIQVLGWAASVMSLVLTWRACRKTIFARNKAHPRPTDKARSRFRLLRSLSSYSPSRKRWM